MTNFVKQVGTLPNLLIPSCECVRWALFCPNCKMRFEHGIIKNYGNWQRFIKWASNIGTCFCLSACLPFSTPLPLLTLIWEHVSVCLSVCLCSSRSLHLSFNSKYRNMFLPVCLLIFLSPPPSNSNIGTCFCLSLCSSRSLHPSSNSNIWTCLCLSVCLSARFPLSTPF